MKMAVAISLAVLAGHSMALARTAEDAPPTALEIRAWRTAGFDRDRKLEAEDFRKHTGRDMTADTKVGAVSNLTCRRNKATEAGPGQHMYACSFDVLVSNRAGVGYTDHSDVDFAQDVRSRAIEIPPPRCC